MKELLRLLYLVVVILPLTLLLIGPSLVLAALRGRQKIGPIVLNPGRRGGAGRIGALLFGLLLWLVVWAGVAAVLSGVILPAIGRPSSPTLQANVTLTAPPVVPSSTPTPVPSPTPRQTAMLTPTIPPREEAPTSTPSPVLTPSPTPSPPPPTSTPELPTATPLPPTPSPLPSATLTPSPTPLATLSPTEAGRAINAVETANDLLRAAVMEPSIGNLAALETFWRGEALAKAQAFAQDLSQRYLPPLDVTYVYLSSPMALEGKSPDTARVISTEAWTYTGPRSVHGESFEFTYTLRRDGEGWVITDYAYGYASITLPSGEGDRLTPTPVPSTITATVVITPAGQ